MQIKTITVRYGRTQSLESYSNVRPEITLSAELGDGDDPDAAKAALLYDARAFVEEMIDQALEAEGEHAKFSREPRYQVITTTTVGGGWSRDPVQEPPERLVIVLPNETRLERHQRDDGVRACWWEEQAGKMRLSHALTEAARYLAEHEEYRLIDASDGDLSRVPAWVFEAVVKPEPVAEPVTVGDDVDDEGEEDDE